MERGTRHICWAIACNQLAEGLQRCRPKIFASIQEESDSRGVPL
jgi:hypothetical protein